MTKAKKKPSVAEFRYFPCTGAAFELLKAYRDEIDGLSQSHLKLHQEFQERSMALHQHHQGNLKSMWARLSAMVGLDPDKTWGNAEYQIEARYIEDGFGAIIYQPQQRGDLLHTLLRGGGIEQGPTEDDPHGETAPDKSRLN